MSDWGRGERISIKDSGKTQKRYGSTSTYVKKDHLVDHQVAKTDTLPGLALKYNTSVLTAMREAVALSIERRRKLIQVLTDQQVASNRPTDCSYLILLLIHKCQSMLPLEFRSLSKTEQIRRVNRLYASDSLFLRDVLKIPVSREVADAINNGCSVSGHSSSGSTSESASGTFNSSISTESYSDDDEKSASDFLGKIDSAIASTRAQVKHVQQHSHFVDVNDPTMVKRRAPNKRQSPASLQQTDQLIDLPQHVVLNHDRKVRNSLHRHQLEQDALFEL